MRRILFSLILFAGPAPSAPQAVEISAPTMNLLPAGKEADGILGDLVLRNEAVEVLISQNAADRRPNMSTYYGADGITPGCIYDLGLRGAANDQLVIFAPGGQRGRVSWVRIAKDGSDGEAVVETVITAPSNGGIFERHAYSLKDGWQGIEITTTLRNESEKAVTVAGEDRWGSFSRGGDPGNFKWGDAIDPADRCGYAVEKTPAEVNLNPGEEKSFTRFLAVGRSPAEAMSVLLERRGAASMVELVVLDEHGRPAPGATVMVEIEGREVPAYPALDGRVVLRLPGGKCRLKAMETGRAPVELQADIAFGKPTKIELKLAPQSAVAFDVKDPEGRSLPCKAMFKRLNGKPGERPDLGPSNRAHGCADQWHNENGKFRVPLPPGKYQVRVVRGPEYASLQREIELGTGRTIEVSGVLRRIVQTPGWISADFHNHTTQSGDNTCGVDDRIINLAAEQIEFAPTTEHNRLYDWTPHIKKLGLSPWLATVPGMELTGRGEHLNAFPFSPEPGKQDNGAPKWTDDPRIAALTLRTWQKKEPDRYIQGNHPNFDRIFRDYDQDGIADEGFFGVESYIDAWETENTMDDGILQSAPLRIYPDKDNPVVRRVRINRQFLWLQLLNQGHRLRGIAAADAHTVYGNGVGGWRNYLPSKTDDPDKIDWREISGHAKAGRCLITNGPFLEVTRDGKTVSGSELSLPDGELTVHVKVQCTDWLKITRVLALVNGREVPEAAWAVDPGATGVIRFEKDVTVRLKEDAHLIFVAYGDDSDLSGGFGSSQQHILKPCAYLNPVYIDVDGGGFKPNKDNLGFEFPTSGMTVEKAEAFLKNKK